MLQVSDENQPVVDPEVRDDEHQGDLGERALVCPVCESSKVGQDTNVGSNNLPVVLGLEEDGVGVEVWAISCAIKVREGSLRLVPLG